MMEAKTEYKKYMKQKILSTAKVIFCQIFILILFISLWQILSDKGIINAFLCSSPKKVVTTIIKIEESPNKINLFTDFLVFLFFCILSPTLSTIV